MEQSGPFKEEKRTNNFSRFIKNLFVMLALVVVVGISFMVSFQLGKKLLTPTTKFAEQRIKTDIPEPPPSIKSLQKVGISVSPESRTLKTAIPPGPAQPTNLLASPQKQTSIKERKKTSLRPSAAVAPYGHYYKLQAGLFADKTKAQELAGRLQAANCAVFIKKVAGGWRTQAGAFRRKTEAANAQQNLAAKGFQSTIVYE